MLEVRSPESLVEFPFQLLSATPTTASSKAQWPHIVVEHHCLHPAGEYHWCLPSHTIRITLQAGYLERRINGGRLQRHPVRTGDIIITPAYSQEWLRSSEPVDFLNMYLDPTFLNQVAETWTSYRSLEVDWPEEVIEDPLILQIGLALRTEIETASAHVSLMYVESLANTLVAHLLKRFSNWKVEEQLMTGRLSTVCMRQVVDYIHANLHQPLTLTGLADVAGLSPHHFARMFKQAMGVSPHQYILHRRIEQAKTLLLKQNVSLATIASELGCVDQSHFTRAFKRLVGMTPHAFLLQHSKNIP